MLARTVTCCVLFLLVACAAATADEKDTKKQAELKWAKGVASDFLSAMIGGDNDQAAMLMTAEFKKRISDVPNWLLRARNDGMRKAHTVTDEQIAPDQDEASFKGLLQGEKREAGYSLRVVREKDSGRWRVTFFRYDDVRDLPAPKE